MVARTQVFQPAKLSVARAAAPAITRGSTARTAPAPTRRTTTRRSSSVDTMLSQLNTGGSKAPLKPLVPLRLAGGGGQRSILGQFWDLAKNLPQGLVGFGKDVLTDAAVVPHLAFDAIRGDIGSPNDYLPATGGMITSFKNTGYDITHPQEFIDAYNEGRIVGKLVEDVGNVAIFAGGASKALGAGAATGIMSAEEAGQFAARGGGQLTGRTLEEAAAEGVSLSKSAAKSVPTGTSIADAAQFGGRELAEYTLPARGGARFAQKLGASPEFVEGMRTAGNVVRKYGHYGEQAGNLPALPYQYAGRGINKLAEMAGIEGGVSGGLRQVATKVAPEIMFRSTPEGQVTRRAMSAAEQAGTRATRFVLGADKLAQKLKLTPEEGTAVLDMIERPYLGQGFEHFDDAELGAHLDRAYASAEADVRPTVAEVRKLMEYRDRTLPAQKLAAMDQVREAQEAIAQDRTARMVGPEQAALEQGTPAEPGRPRPVLPLDPEAVNAAYDKLSGAEAEAVDKAVKEAMYDDVFNKHPERSLDELRAEEMARRGHIDTPTYRGGEPPGVVPGRPIVGATPRGLHPEQLGNEVMGRNVTKLQESLEKGRDLTLRQAESEETRLIRDERMYNAQVAANREIPAPPSPRVEFAKGVAKEKARNADSFARRRWEQAQRALNDAVDEYTKLSEGGPSPAVERAGKEVERLTAEVTKLHGIIERNTRRVDAAQGLSRASGEVQAGTPRVPFETAPVRDARVQVERTLADLAALNERYGLEGPAPVLPPQLRAEGVVRGEAASRQLGRLEGAVSGAKEQATNAEAGLRRSEAVLESAEKADQRSIAKAAQGVERAATAEEKAGAQAVARAADPAAIAAEQLAPDVEAYDPYRQRTGTTKTGEKTQPMSAQARARVREGQLLDRVQQRRAKVSRLRKSVERYNEKIAGARTELSRSFQDRLHEDVKPAATQLRSAVASGGQRLGNIVGEGDSAALNGVLATLGDKHGMYDDLVQALDEATTDKGEALGAYEVSQVVNDVLRERPDVVLDVPDRTLLDDAIGRDTLLEDMDMVLAEEVADNRRLNSPYRLMDVIDAHAWNMPQESYNRVRAAFDRWQVRRGNTINKVYNQWSAAVPARFRPAVQDAQRQIGALIEGAEAKNKAFPGSGDVDLDLAEATMSTLSEMVEQGFDPQHLTGGKPAAQTSAASTATSGGLGRVKTRGQYTRKSGLRQRTLAAYARVESEEASRWIRDQRNAHIERELGVRADSLPEVQEALAAWAEEHNGETMPPRTLAKVATDAGFVPITDKDVSPQTILIPHQVYKVLTPSAYNNVLLRGLARTNRAFKTWVLPFSPKWQIGNVLGNVIQAWVHGGVSPVELLTQMNRIRKYEGGAAALWQKAGLPDWARPEIANHGLTIDEYRTNRGLEDQPPRTPIGKFAQWSFRINEFVDNLTRSATDLAALARGESTDQALQTTVRSLGDYSRMSTFERKVIREVIPFYAWIRHSTVATLRLPISSPARAAFVFHLADVYRNPEEQGELFGSRIDLGGGLLNLGTISPLQDVTGFVNPGEIIGPALSPTVKFAASSLLGLDLGKMAAITRPEDTALKDPYGRPKTTAPIATLARNPLAGIGELFYQATQQGPGTIKNVRDYVLGDETRYSGTGYRSGFTDPRRRSVATLLRALNLPSIDQPPDTRS